MIWREPKDHVTDCSFCLTKIEGVNAKNKSKIISQNLPSGIRPVAHCDEIPIPIYKESNLDEPRLQISQIKKCQTMNIKTKTMPKS